MRRPLTLFFLMVATLSVAASTPDWIAPDSIVRLDGISVTAIKQSLNLRNEAIASSVIDITSIERQGISVVKQLSSIAPNFYIPDYGSRMTSSVYVRGLGTRIEQPVIGLIVDNVPIADKNMYDMEIADMERMEVLRGPQSTLFGRNTMCGLVNIYTLSPMTYQGTRIGIEYGSRNAVRASASTYHRHNNVAGSVGASFNRLDGYFRNTYDGRLCDNEMSGSLRSKQQYRKGSFGIDNVVALSALQQGGYPYASTETRQICYNDNASYRRFGVSDGLTIRYQMPKSSISSVTSYQFMDDRMCMDQDYTPESYFTLEQAKSRHDIAEDLVFRGKTGKYDWIAGLFGSYRYERMNAPVVFKEDGIARLILDNVNPHYDGEYRWGDSNGYGGDSFTLGSRFATHNASLAAYHQSSLRLGRWNLTMGVRFEYEHLSMRYDNTVSTAYTAFPADSSLSPQTVQLNIADTGILNKSFFAILPKFSISYAIDKNEKNMLYLSAAKGTKAGGFNTQMFSEVLQRRLQSKMGLGVDLGSVERTIAYRPEKSWNFELGGHFATRDEKLTADAALFFIYCTDQQLTVFPEGQTTGRMMTNAGKTRSAGVEASIAYRPHKSVTSRLAYGFTDARFVRFVSGHDNYAGKHIPYAPSHTLSCGIDWTITVGASKWLQQIVLGADCSAVGRIYWSEKNTLSQPFYALLGATVRAEGKRWAIQVMGRNLSCTKYDVFYFESMGRSFLQRGRPCTVSVKAEVKF